MEPESRPDALVAEYLAHLSDALAPLPRGPRERVMAEIEGRIAAARRALDADDLAGVQATLDRLGDPHILAVVAARAQPALSPVLDAVVPWLLLLGAVVYGIGWLVGVVLLWKSDSWSVRDKVLGTLVWPGGIVLPVLALALPGSTTSCSGGPGAAASHCVTVGFVLSPWLAVPAVLIALACPILVAFHLMRVRRTVA